MGLLSTEELSGIRFYRSVAKWLYDAAVSGISSFTTVEIYGLLVRRKCKERKGKQEILGL